MVERKDEDPGAGVGCRGAADESPGTAQHWHQVSRLRPTPAPREEGDPSGLLGQGRSWGWGDQELSRGWGGGRCRRPGSVKSCYHSGEITIRRSFSMSYLTCGAAGGTGPDLDLACWFCTLLLSSSRQGAAELRRPGDHCLVFCAPVLRAGQLPPTRGPKCQAQALNN